MAALVSILHLAFAVSIAAGSTNLAPRHATDGSAAPCVADWVPTFGEAPGTDDPVLALTPFDDGSGSKLFVAGLFSTAGDETTAGIAAFDGTSWESLAGGVDGIFPLGASLAVFDDGSGSGPSLFVGGGFTSIGGTAANNIARWDGEAWSPVGTGTNGSVTALAVFDDGSGAGPALYAGGHFTFAGGVLARHIARWDGANWTAVGPGLNGLVRALTVYDDGSGPKLIAAGQFSHTGIGAIPLHGIAQWNGQIWRSVGGGVQGAQAFVRTLAVVDGEQGGSATLAVGGSFIQAGGVVVNHVATWDGHDWSTLGAGMNHIVETLAVFDDGGGPALIAGGQFTAAGGIAASHIAKWDGTNWRALGSGLGGTASALTVHDDGSGGGAALYVGGHFTIAGGLGALRVARWDGLAWSTLGGDVSYFVGDLAVFDAVPGGPPELVATGAFGGIEDPNARWIAAWNGATWDALGSGIDGLGNALTVFDDGSGPRLVAGGDFDNAGGVSATNVAAWDGEGWSALGSGTPFFVLTLAAFDDGSGAAPGLYAGGYAFGSGAPTANLLAHWDGAVWGSVGSGVTGEVRALAVFDDGSGSALYVGGAFSSAGGLPTGGIARWDGDAWSTVGGGLNDSVSHLTVFDDGTGPALYACGSFTVAGGTPANRVARWDGRSWSALGSGMDGGVGVLHVHDEGFGPRLFAGGSFTTAGGQSANSIARWDGSSWSALGAGVSGQSLSFVGALASFDDGKGGGPGLFVGGGFTVSPAADSYLAKWGCAAGSFAVLSGCAGNPAALTARSPALVIGAAFDLSLAAGTIGSGFGLLFAGADGTDASGCGLVVPGLGELLLSVVPAPFLLATVPLGSGTAGFTLAVPDSPGLVGVEVTFQGLTADPLDPALPIEASNGLATTIQL